MTEIGKLSQSLFFSSFFTFFSTFLSDGISRVSEITGKTIPAHSVNLLDKEALQDLFSKVE